MNNKSIDLKRLLKIEDTFNELTRLSEKLYDDDCRDTAIYIQAAMEQLAHAAMSLSREAKLNEDEE